MECFWKNVCNALAVRPMSSARRIDASLIRYTMAAPADSTLATSVSASDSSRLSGPGTTTVRSACSRKWSIGSGRIRFIAATATPSGAPVISARAGVLSAARPTRPSAVASSMQIGDRPRLQSQ